MSVSRYVNVILRKEGAMATLKTIMTGTVVTLSPETTLLEAIGILRAENVSGAPVVRNDQVVGVVSASDILDFEVDTVPVPTERPSQMEWDGLEEERFDDEDIPAFYSQLWDGVGAEVAERFASDTGPEWDFLEEHVVAEVMTRGVFALPPDTRLDEAAEYMTRRGIHRVLVMEGRRLLGIASASDFVRAVAEHRT
jgi:CBS domain-containing protein